MTIVTVQFMSEVLWREVTYTCLLPDEGRVGTGPYPVLYQLHGGNQNHTAWLYASNLLTASRSLPFIVVLPDGAQSRWANGGAPYTRYEDFLMQDFAAHVRRTFHASAGKWAIGGLSMGGVGAVRLGLKYPERFFSVWAHSACYPRAEHLPAHWYWTGSAEDLDCYRLAEQVNRDMLPRLSFDCGTEDLLLHENRTFHAFLEERSIPHSYYEHPDGHMWSYWNTHLPDALNQHIAEFQRLQGVPDRKNFQS